MKVINDSFVIGKIHTVKELDNISFSRRKDLRERIRFLVIDDEPFVYLEKLRNVKFNIMQIHDISDLHAISEYQVIICDINGVGNSFSEEYGGAFVINQMKAIYPTKQYAYYSGKPVYSQEMMNLLKDITSIPKDAEINQWISYFDQFIENTTNPKFVWKQIRDLCVADDVSSCSIALLENEYVKRFKKNPSLLNSLNYSDYGIEENLKALIQSIIASLLASLIITA